MTTYDWTELRNRATQLFNGDTPGAELEQAIINHFTRHPGRVRDTIESVGRRVTNGTIHSGWAILRKELDTKPATAQATDTNDRTTAIALTETWLRNTGGYINHPDELDDEVFGPRGRLYRWNNDQQLRDHIHTLWLEQRPRFQRAEHEAEERARRTIATLQRVRKAIADTLPDQDAHEHAQRITAEVERARQAAQTRQTSDDIDWAAA